MANSSTYIYRTPSSTGSNTISTFSAWLKKTVNGSYEGIFTSVYETGEFFEINFETGDSLEVRAKVSSSYVLRKITTRKFRDNSAFYHIVVAIDTTDGTAEDRCKIYVNGTRETSFSTNTNPSQNQNLNMNTGSSYQHRIGRDEWTTPAYYDGLMAHVHWVDGTAYQASTFGESDSVSGIWKPKTNPSVTYGTNGFFFKFENSGNMDLDSSGNNHTFTTGGTLTQNIDTPSNNFATWNPLKTSEGSNVRIPSFDLGNTRANFDNASYNESAYTTLAVSSGKWYCEMKAEDISANANTRIGIANIEYTGSSFQGNDTNTFTYQADGNKRVAGTASSYGNTYTTGDIIGIAMDLDNQKLYFSKNGVFQNSGVPTSGSTGTGAISINSNINYSFYAEDYASSGNKEISANFGQGYFGTTQVASAGTAPSEGGIFEYDCPSGYQSLCTKGINSF